MEDGFLKVEVRENKNTTNKKNQTKKMTKGQMIGLICTAIFVFIISIVVPIVVSTITKDNFEKDFGGYETAQEYVDNLVDITNIIPVENSYISSWYGDKITIKNNADKSVKYIKYSLAAYNAVGDYVKSEFDDTKFNITGPIEQGESQTYSGDRTYYCKSTIKSFKITYFSVEFIDGTKVVYNKAMIEVLNGGK